MMSLAQPYRSLLVKRRPLPARRRLRLLGPLLATALRREF